MSLTNISITTKVAMGLVGLALIFGFAFATPANAATADELQAQINSLLATIAALQAQISSLEGGGGGTSASDCGFTRDLTLEVSGDDVVCLQDYLTGTGHFTFSGGSTGYFGPITQSAVAAWQAANNVNPPAGYFGPISMAKYSSLLVVAPPADGGDVTPPVDDGGDVTPPAPAGTGLTVSSAAQPSATLAPFNAARVPFTKFTVTAGSDGDVVMSSVVVERQGLSVDANFAGIVLLDEDNQLLGLSKTLNSNHQAKVGEAVTIKAGQSRTFTVAGNMGTAANINSGEVASLAVVAINTSATVSGSLPITGASHTMNNTLTIGSLTVARGPLDPNNAVSKEVGTVGYTFASLRVTNGSAEKARLWSVRWNQGSSTSSADLENTVVVVNDVEYPTTVSGDFYTALFPGGLALDKGANIDISIKSDISGGSGRTVAFTINKTTDLYVTGELYGYGLTPPTTGTGISDGTIWFPSQTVTVSAGSIAVTQNTAVTSQNIAINVAGQTLGGIKVVVDGEPVTVSQIVFDMGTSTGGMGRVTDFSIVDSNGAIVAGPVDCTAICDNNSSITLTDAITFPVGESTYTMVGKIGTVALNDATYQLTTNPATDWTTVTGDNTGDTITPTPSGDQALQTMTVKAAALTLSVSNSPADQTIVSGVQGFTFANYQLDATASGEDIRLNNIPLDYNDDSGATETDLTNCQLWDGSTALNTGTNSVDPSSFTAITFTFDTGFEVPKGTLKTLALKCNLASGATGSVTWGYNSASTFTGTGLTSGSSVTPSAATAVGQVITYAANGTLTALLDASSPSYGLAAANTTGNTLAILKFTADNEAIDLQKIELQLTNVASSSASDVTQVTIWQGATQVGSAIFTASNFTATTTLTTPVTIAKDGVAFLTVKADFTAIGTGQAGVQGHFVAVDYLVPDVNHSSNAFTQGVGASSGATATSSSGSTSSTGVRVFKSYPTLEKLAVPTNTLSNGVKDLARWKVSAQPTGDVGVHKFTLTIASTTATVASLDIYCYTNSSFSSVCSGLDTDGGFRNTDTTQQEITDGEAENTGRVAIVAQTSGGTNTAVQVPAGGSLYFVARATVSGSAAGASISTQLEGDAGYVDSSGDPESWFVLGTAKVDASTHDDFIWSGNATSTSLFTHGDWSNGYGVSGLPGSSMTAEVLSQ